MTTWIALFALGVVVMDSVLSSPMYYKKTDEDTYEPGKISKHFIVDTLNL